MARKTEAAPGAAGAHGSGRQQAQQELVEQALRQPGVAEALAVFNQVRQYAPAPTVMQRAGTRHYATGGNLS